MTTIAVLLFGIILGIAVTIGSVRVGIASARYIWKHSLAIVVLGMIAFAVLLFGGPQPRPRRPVFDDKLQVVGYE